MTPATLLYRALTDPGVLAGYSAEQWNALIRVARAERLFGSLAALAKRQPFWEALPAGARRNMDDELSIVAADHLRARFEIDRAAHALASLHVPVILMKGSAYLAAGLTAGSGRRIGDLDILVPRPALADVEAALREHGWLAAKEDAYDDHYYRAWMHELPPLVHGERGCVIDVHHSILPLTARLQPDAEALVASRVRTDGGVFVLGDVEMVLHAATHLAYDGEFEGGSRNLWDIHQLIGDFAGRSNFWERLEAAAALHQLTGPIRRALRLAAHLYGTTVPDRLLGSADSVDRLALRKMHGRDAFGIQQARIASRLLYMRGHWLRMPPAMLARHLTRKFLVRRGLWPAAAHRSDQ
jgi:hypothetical protein